MASPSPDIPAQTEIDTRIDALLHDVNAAGAAMSDALSPTSTADQAAPAGLGNDFDTALDDALVSTLLNEASAEIEASAPGALELPPEVELPADAAVDPSLVAVEQSLVGADAVAAPPAPPEPLAPVAEATSPELEGVLGDLNTAPAPVEGEATSTESTSDDLLGAVSELLDQPKDEPSAASAAIDTGAPAVLSPALAPAPDPALIPAPTPEAADAESLAAAMLDVSAALEPDHAPAPPVPAPAPIAPRGGGGSINSSGPAQDFEFVSPEALSHEKSPSVRELDEQLASAAPKAVEAAISAAAAKATKPDTGDPGHHTSAHALSDAPPERLAPPTHGVHADTPVPATAPPSSPHTAGASAASAAPSLAAADAHVHEPTGPGVLSKAMQGTVGLLGAALSPLVRMHSKLGESMRQTVGYVAVMTLFFAVAIWAFYLLKESPKLDAVSPQKTLLMPGEHAPESAHADGHASEGAAHANADAAHAPAGASSHAPSKPAKKDDAHGGGGGSGGGGHGESKSAKKEPPKKTSSTKKDAAKKGADKKGAQQASGH